MSTDLHSKTASTLLAAAEQAGLPAATVSTGADFHGNPTARLSFPGATTALTLEVSEGFSADTPELAPILKSYFAETAQRLRNPQPELFVTIEGLPLRFTGFQWPFHRSTSGADTYIVHGTVALADGTDTPLHAKVSASMTVTFAEVIPAPEQPFSEDFIYNAIRRTFDYGQLELLKSGNRQPVPVTMRYYSRWNKQFIFSDTTEQQRAIFLSRKAFWLSGVMGGSAPVWLADPRDAQYLNVPSEQLLQDAQALAKTGAITLNGEFGAATPALLAHEADYRAELAALLERIKPAFNEEMRAGHTNM